MEASNVSGDAARTISVCPHPCGPRVHGPRGHGPHRGGAHIDRPCRGDR
jgi:hypothetical protein